MCTDVIDGYLALGNHEKLEVAEVEIIARLNSELFHSKEKKLTGFSFRKLAVAASVLLVTGISLFFLLNRTNTADQAAQTNPQKSKQTGKMSDTLLIARNEPQKLSFQPNQEPKKVQENREDTYDMIMASDEVAKNESEPIVPKDAVPKEIAKASEKAAPISALNRSLQMKTEKSKLLLNNGSFLISGKVTDASTGESLPGVSVVVKGTTRGAVTDSQGKFHIEVPDTQSLLTLSFIGFTTKDVIVTPGLETTVAMVADVTKLEEVVVVGYGTQKKSDVTGSVTSVSAEEQKQQTEELQAEIDSLQQKLLAQPDNRAIWLELTKKYLETENAIQGKAALNKVKELSPENMENDINEIIVLIQQKKFSRAIRKLKKLR
jgi:hypothetical protein